MQATTTIPRTIITSRPVTTAPVRRVSAATYRRRRAVVGGVSAVLVAAGLVLAHDVLAGSGGAPASAAVSLPARATIVAEPGDTLWSIAERHHGDIPVDTYVATLIDINGGAAIRGGDVITLP